MKSVEQWLFFVFLLLVIIANLSNSANQIMTLWRVNRIVHEQKNSLEGLQKKQKTLEVQIRYAQSEEYQQRAQRILLGMGNSDDYWILLPKHQDLSSVYPTALETTPKANIPHWKRVVKPDC